MQQRLTCAYKKMGAIPLHTCTPYHCGFLPLNNQHVAWGESSAVVLGNSLFGGRTNREGGPSALASAITGKTPEYGYHCWEHRKGKVEVKVNCDLSTISDFGAMGYYVGALCQEKVPVFSNVSFPLSLEQYKALGAALASSGSVAVFHVANQTPLADTFEETFDYDQPEEIIEFGEREKEEAWFRLQKAKNQRVDLVALGCPHTSLLEIREIARYLSQHQDKKIKADLWVMTSISVKQTADYLGYSQAIEEAGGHLVTDTCLVLGALGPVIDNKKYYNVATNSAKLAHYVPGQWSLGCYFGNLKECLDAAFTGWWKG